MKLKAHNTLLWILMVLPVISWASDKDITASKHYEKSFSVSSGAELELDGSFASFTLENWDKNEIFVSGDINVEARNEDKANKVIENFKVEMTQSGNKVSVVVEMNGSNSWDNNGSTEMDVNFTIKVPSSIDLDANVSFGSLKFDDLENAKVDVEYGDLTAGVMSGSKNDLEISFGSASVGEFAGGDVENSYGELKIGKLTGNAEVENSYGACEIKGMTGNAKNLELENSFGETTLYVSSSMSYDVHSKSSFGEVKISGDWKEKTENSDFQDKETTGTLGKGGSTGTIEIQSSFGEVKVKQD